MTIKNKKNQSGFTVIELMVAMSLFLILVSLASVIFVQTLKTQRIITKLTAANDNATQAIEQIAREVRTGFAFSESSQNVLKFTNYRNEVVNYKLVDKAISRCIGDCRNNADFAPITAPEVDVHKMKFNIQGEETTDNFPTRVTITISVLGPRDIEVNLQTTVSARILEPEM